MPRKSAVALDASERHNHAAVGRIFRLVAFAVYRGRRFLKLRPGFPFVGGIRHKRIHALGVGAADYHKLVALPV